MSKMRFGLWIVLLVALSGCHREASERSFVNSLRCGMTRDEVSQLARKHGYNPSDPSWLTRAAASQSKKSKELMLTDLTFRAGSLVAVRQGTYDPRTKRTTWKTTDLCGEPGVRYPVSGTGGSSR